MTRVAAPLPQDHVRHTLLVKKTKARYTKSVSTILYNHTMEVMEPWRPPKNQNRNFIVGINV
jgi:hypothetical protein